MSAEDRQRPASTGPSDSLHRAKLDVPVSNYPLSYKLSWLPRLLRPSLAGDRNGLSASAATLIDPQPMRKVRLAFVGDISAVANRDTPECDPAIAALLSSADLVIGNCESPIVERPRAIIGTLLGTHHAMSERFLADALAAAGVARDRLVLSLANNHVLDQGIGGFEETLAALNQLGIRTIGTVADGPVQVHAAGSLAIGFAAFSLWRNTDAAPFEERISMRAAEWRRDAVSGIDLTCAVPHWDWEFRHSPRPATRALARRLADNGARLIVGHHAHVVQPIEHIGDSVIAYGLGDFFGTAFAKLPWPARVGSIFVVDVSADPATRGAIAACKMHFFMRLRVGSHERLVPVEALDGALKQRVAGRLKAIFPTRQV
jgi:poly-gamma-glutamate synthesis protein (capsule biosynthesis protein)